jgi:hypothetical protein
MVREDYFKWLCNLACSERGGPEKALTDIFLEMYNFHFHGFVGYDFNREEDGLELRKAFYSSYDSDERLDEPCTMLEMVLSLTKAMSFTMFNFVKDSSIHRWVVEMCINCGALVRDGNGYSCAKNVREILQRIQDRAYRKDGTGGFFPMISDDKDQREVEIWYQANEYLIENYM